MAADQVAPHEQWDIVSSVGLTALGVAVGRALETKNGTGLVDDPYAERFVRAAQPDGEFASVLEGGIAAAQSGDPDTADLWAAMAAHLGLRSRFFDEYFERAKADGVRQVVLLASGLDARPQRLDWPQDLQLFEIDQPLVLDFKERVLDEAGAQDRCQRHAVRVDLRDDWRSALLNAGFDPQAPTAWLAEGLLVYLPQDAERALLETISELSAPGSRIALEHASQFSDTLNDPLFERVSNRFGVDMHELVHSDDRQPALERLAGLGWSTAWNQDGASIASHYGREVPEVGAAFLDRVHYATSYLN